MSAVAKRRKPTLLGTILADPYRKLTAIILAVTLWYFLNSQVTREIEVRAVLETAGLNAAASQEPSRIRVQLGDANWIGRRFSADDKETNLVVIVLRGKNARIDNLENDGLEFKVNFAGVDWSARDSIEFTVRDLQPPAGLDDIDFEMRPPRIRLDVEKLDEQSIPISIDKTTLTVEQPGLEQRLQRDRAQFSPPTATVRGPASRISEFQRRLNGGANPFRARVTARPGQRSALTVLQLNSPTDWGLRLDPVPTMTIPVRPISEVFEVEIPLIIDDLALPAELRGKFRPTEDKALWSVRVSASGDLRGHLTSLATSEDPEALRDWARNHLRLNLFLGPLGAEPGNEIVSEAVLQLQGPLLTRVEPDDYSLEDSVAITLSRTE